MKSINHKERKKNIVLKQELTQRDTENHRVTQRISELNIRQTGSYTDNKKV